MKNRIIVSLVAFGAVAAGVAYFASSRETPLAADRPHSASNKDKDSDEVNELRSEVAALRREARNNAKGVNELRAETGRISDVVAVASAQVAQEQDSAPSPGIDSEERAAWVAERQAMIATKESEFRSEARNAEWSSKTESSIREAASKHGTATQVLREIDCRAKTCRVEVIDDQEATQDLNQFLMDCSQMFPTMVADHVTGPDNKASYVFYLMSDA